MANMRQGFQNVELIDKTIRSIREARCFSMASWDTCICGHVARAARKDWRLGFIDHADEYGAQMLGIDLDQAADLFCSNLDADAREAIRCLQILRDEGIVDWRRARKEVHDDEVESARIEAEAWELNHNGPSYLDRLYERFEELCMKARLTT